MTKMEVIKIKFKSVLPYVALAIIVFVAVTSSFVCYDIYVLENKPQVSAETVESFQRKNVFVSVSDSQTNTLNTNYIVSFNPKDKSVKTIYIPGETEVNIASSRQALKDVLNIGDSQMLRDVLKDVIPIPVHYHLVIKSDDLYSENGDYDGLLKYVFSEYLWQVEDLDVYLNQILSLSNTDLTLVKTGDYATFLNSFKEHVNYNYSFPGKYENVDNKILYVADPVEVNLFVNTKILNP